MKLQSILSLIFEDKEDLQKQCVVLMGIPAAGKSTFVKTELKKLFHGIPSFSVTNSDVQLVKTQYDVAFQHYDELMKATDKFKDNEKALGKFIDDFKNRTKYEGNTSYNKGETIIHPVDLNWWLANKSKGAPFFYKTFRKDYYACYYDMRLMAQTAEEGLFGEKIVTGANIMIIDTSGASPSKLLERLDKTKKEGFTNTVIFLDIDPELAIVRDAYRKKKEGRGVGADVILSYATKIYGAFTAYVADGNDQNGVVDVTYHFKWSPGDSPIHGTWHPVSHIKHYRKRKLNK